jgi:hypothetical protein
MSFFMASIYIFWKLEDHFIIFTSVMFVTFFIPFAIVFLYSDIIVVSVLSLLYPPYEGHFNPTHTSSLIPSICDLVFFV